MKLIVDTNTALSSLFKPESRPAQIVQLWRDGAFEWMTCSHQLEELSRVLSRPKIISRIPGGLETAQQFVQQLHADCTLVALAPPFAALCRDPKDDYLMTLLLKSKAMHMVSGDKDLLVLKDKWPAIVTATEFLDRL